MFATHQGRYQHNKNVNCKPPATIEPSPCTIINNNNNDNRITNNNNKNTTNNITNNNITIQLNVHGKENYDALLATIRTKYPQAFVTMVEEGDTASLLKLVHFNKDFPENQTIRKPAKKDVSAEVHMGEGRWEKRPTQDVIETFRGQTSKRLCDSLQTNMNISDKRNDMYLKEILYEQSKEPNGNTDSLMLPFMMSDQDMTERELTQRINTIKHKMIQEYPTMVGTKMFNDMLKKESRRIVDEFTNEWSNMYTT